LVLLALVLVCVVAGLAFVYLGAKQKVGKANEELAKVTTLAQEVDKITAETSTIAGRLKPIADKIAFIAQADECGYPYWDRFYEVNEYIYGQAQVLAFAIAADKAPAGPVGDGTPEALYNLSGPGGSTLRVPGLHEGRPGPCALHPEHDPLPGAQRHSLHELLGRWRRGVL